jgi:hypothetical protein
MEMVRITGKSFYFIFEGNLKSDLYEIAMSR